MTERHSSGADAATEGSDARWMERALALAERGRGAVSPNPMVGAVIVGADGALLGEGFHARYGGLHAEAAALADAREGGHDPRGATMFVTLEPCAHHGRQPPCADAVRDAGLARVVIGADDPSAKAAGRGPGLLVDAGVGVEWIGGEQAHVARLLVQPFRKHSRTGKPLVIFKSAVSLDGRTTSAAGESRWISGGRSRRLVHGWRAEVDAVAVGIDTVLADDPVLTARDVGASRQPARVVFDRSARLPLDSALVRSVGEADVIVIAGPEADRDRLAALAEAGVEAIAVDGSPAQRVGAALGLLGERPITSMLLEGGSTLAGAFRDADEIDEARLFYAPILLGGVDARPMLGGDGSARVEGADRAVTVDWERIGGDMLARARMREW